MPPPSGRVSQPPAEARASQPPPSRRQAAASPATLAPPASTTASKPAAPTLSTPVGSSPAAGDEGLFMHFEQVVSQITLHVQNGSYVAEQCSMLVEIAKISATSNCPAALRERALSLLLELSRRPDGQGPCRRGVSEVLNQCLARGLKVLAGCRGVSTRGRDLAALCRSGGGLGAGGWGARGLGGAGAGGHRDSP